MAFFCPFVGRFFREKEDLNGFYVIVVRCFFLPREVYIERERAGTKVNMIRAIDVDHSFIFHGVWCISCAQKAGLPYILCV